MLTFILIFVVLLPLFVILGGEYTGEHGRLIGAPVALNLSVVLGFLFRFLKKSSKGGVDSVLKADQEAPWKHLERQEAGINKARRLKAQNNSDQALKMLNRVLKENPNCPEALFIKAQILLEEFQNSNAASRCLKQVITHTSEAIELNEQAVALYKDLNPGSIYSGEFVHLVRKKTSV